MSLEVYRGGKGRGMGGKGRGGGGKEGGREGKGGEGYLVQW